MVRERGGAALERAAETAWQAGRRGRGRRGGGVAGRRQEYPHRSPGLLSGPRLPGSVVFLR